MRMVSVRRSCSKLFAADFEEVAKLHGGGLKSVGVHERDIAGALFKHRAHAITVIPRIIHLMPR